MKIDTSPEILTGQTEKHLKEIPELQAKVHTRAVSSLQGLREEAAKEGFDLQIASSFRSFEHQLKIWNLKATGQRALLDPKGNPIEFSKLSPDRIVEAILRWSALPGGSRHHWGTEIDVFDAKSVPAGYQVQLVPAEVAPTGMFGRLHAWLDEAMEDFGFYRPYKTDRGGVSPERWHLSYAPVSATYYQVHSVSILEETLRNAPIELKDIILRDLKQIHLRYLKNIDLPAGTA